CIRGGVSDNHGKVALFRGPGMVSVRRCPRGHTWTPAPRLAGIGIDAETCPECGDSAVVDTPQSIPVGDTPRPFVVPTGPSPTPEQGEVTHAHLGAPQEPSFSSLIGMPGSSSSS